MLEVNRMSEEDSNIDDFADQMPLENQSADSAETELGQTGWMEDGHT